MSNSKLPFTYPSSLENYMVTKKDFLALHPQYQQLVTGAVVFDDEGKMLLIKRAAGERFAPNFWEIPGGKVDDGDESILQAAVRELKEETGLDATKIVRKVTEDAWLDGAKGWLKTIFEVEVASKDVVLDPVEHDQYLWATEDEVLKEKSGDVSLQYYGAASQRVKLEGFKLRRETAT